MVRQLRFAALAAMLLMTCSVFGQSQGGTVVIKGTVTDETGYPLPGASVMVRGAKAGTVTGKDGTYSLGVSSDAEVLEFSFLGFEKQTVRIKGKTVIDVEMVESADMLDEVISIGYFSTTKSDATGAVQNISLSDAEDRVVSSTDMLLQGKAAGLEMTQDSGQPGSDEMDIHIRGVSSLDNSSAPLIIVDGVESALYRVNPKDIRSVSILKDASSAAIYGNRAAGGVIVIETKQGARGLRLSYSGSASVQQATSFPEIEDDPVKYIDFVNLAWKTAMGNSTFKKYSDTVRARWAEGGSDQYTPVNWRDAYFQPGFMHQHHIGASGGWERSDFSFSAGYQDQTGIVFSTRADKLDYHVKLNLYFFRKKLKVGVDLSGLEKNSSEAQSSSSLISRYLQNRPILFMKAEEDGEVVYSSGATAFAIDQLGGGTTNRYSDLSSIFTVTWTPFDGMTVKGTYNARNSSQHGMTYIPNYETTGSEELDSSSVHRSGLSDRSTWGWNRTLSLTANYVRKKGKLGLNALAGYEMRETGSSWNQTHVYDLIKNAPILAYGNPNSLSTTGSSYEYASLSTFGRVQLIYDNRYIFESNVRYDGSSRFAKGRRFGLFPSAGIAWRIDKEGFMSDARWVDNLKLRLSAGRLGNDNISNAYAYADQMTSEAYYSFGGTLKTGVAYYMFADKNTTWETVDQVNAGIDFDFLKQFRVSADVFDKEVSNMLSSLYPVISLGTGTKGAPQNVGRMRNYGVEFSATWNKTLPNSMYLRLGGHVSYILNRIVSLGDNKEQWHDTEGNLRSVVGKPARSRYGYNCLGLYQLDDFTWQDDSDPSIPDLDREYTLKPGVTATSLHQKPRPGDLLLEDRDGDNLITPNDMVYLGRSRSDLRFSFNVHFGWKNLDFQALFQGQGPATAYLQFYSPYAATFVGQVFTQLEDKYWTEATPQYRCLFADKERLGIVSSHDMYNSAYLRLKNVQLGYSFRGKWLTEAKIKSLRVYLTAENLLTFSSFLKGFDPERSASNSSPSSYPIIKSGSVGASLSF